MCSASLVFATTYVCMNCGQRGAFDELCDPQPVCEDEDESEDEDDINLPLGWYRVPPPTQDHVNHMLTRSQIKHDQARSLRR